MTYSIDKITQAADCDVLLTWAEKEKSELGFKKLSEGRLTQNYNEVSIEIGAILQGVNAEIEAITTVISMLPDGATKESESKKKVRLEYKKFLLETRKESYGVVALLEKELDLERISRELQEVEAFIATVTAHKATL